MTSIGQIGEDFVAQWLLTQGWKILQQRWRSPWGEIDLIALHDRLSIVAFLEVKTRKSRNWDKGGILAVTQQKQAKIINTAEYFLGKYPHLSEFFCRFDVALVHYKPCYQSSIETTNAAIKMGKSIQWQGYQLTLLDYIESAFLSR